MHIAQRFLAFGFAICLSHAYSATCDLNTFGQAKATTTCFWDDCRRTSSPDEVKLIKRGIYVEFVGLSINDGIASWIGVDLDRGELFQVNRFAGQHLKRAPTITTTENHFVRETKTERFHWIDVVRKRILPADALGEIVCLANELWVSKPSQTSFISDVFNELRLVDGVTNRGIGGMRSLPQEAQAFETKIRSYRDIDWKDY